LALVGLLLKLTVTGKAEPGTMIRLASSMATWGAGEMFWVWL